jgi:segregation and condensation protein A
MEELKFRLETFEGPLDLLLSLISKHKLDIRDIEISVLLEQFLLYLDQMRLADMEIAGEFVEMAARLIFIKSSALLPKHEKEALKKELEGALIEYALCKETAGRLRDLYCGDAVFVRSPMPLQGGTPYDNIHQPEEILNAYLIVYKRNAIRNEPPPPVLKPVPPEFVSVFSKVIYVLRLMKKQSKVEIASLYEGQSRSARVATFLALLELAKHSRVEFSEDESYLIFTQSGENHDT